MLTAILEDKATEIKTTITTMVDTITMQEQTIKILMATTFNLSNSNKWIWCTLATHSILSISKWTKLLCSSNIHLNNSARFHRCASLTYTHLILILISEITKETMPCHLKTTITIVKRTSILVMEMATTTTIIIVETIRIQARKTTITISQTITYLNNNNLNSHLRMNLHYLRLMSRLLERATDKWKIDLW